MLSELGSGADATVLRVRRIADGGTYALKVIDRESADPDAATTALCREAALLAGVHHPDLVAVHEVGVRDGRPFLVMDLVEGRSLARLLDGGPMPADQVTALALDLADPLSALHRAGLVHRDVKPGNVMVRTDGRFRLIDFGMAAREVADGSDVAVGTLVYSAPEQSGTLRRAVDARSDLYSLGVVLYECLAGRPPFAGPDVGELLHMHAVVPPPDLAALVPDAPPKLVAAIMRLLAKEPDDRYQTGTDLIAELTGRPHRHRREQIVGRAQETAALRERWEAAKQGAGGTVALHGGSGFGKSRLLRELTERAQGIVLCGSGTRDDPVPMGPLRRAFDGWLRQVDALPAGARARTHERIRACAGASGPVLAAFSEGLAAVLGPAGPPEEQFASTVADFLVALAREGDGLLLALDDADWLDPASRRVLGHLADDADGAPLLVVVAGREPSAIADPDMELAIGPLAVGDVAALVCALLPGTQPDDALTKHLVTRSRGNPFVVREYLRAVADAGLVRPFWGRWVLDEAGLDALALPQDALGLLLSRLDALSEPSVAVLATAAVAGSDVAPEVLTEVLGRPADDVRAALREAVRLGLVEQRAGGGYAFLHVGLRDALAARLDRPTVEATHLAIADALSTVEEPPPERVFAIARHYLAAGAAVPATRALPAYVAAGELALRGNAPADAVTFLGRARELAGAPSVALLHDLGTALMHVGRFGDAAAVLEEAVELENDPLRRAELLVTLSDVCWAGWRVLDGSATLRRGLAELGVRMPRRRSVLLVTTFVMIFGVVFTQLLGLGSSSLQGTERRRRELAADLYTRGFNLSGLEGRIDLWLGYGVRAIYWGNRLGHGKPYAQGQYLLGIFANVLRMRGVARSAFDRMNADPAVTEPGLRALTIYGRALSEYILGTGPAAPVARALSEHGRFLDVGTYSEGAFALAVDAVNQGRNAEAARVADLARRRMVTGSGELSALSLIPVVGAAAQGRLADAARDLEALDRDLGGANGRTVQIYASAARIQVLSEQQEIGTAFDEAADAYEAVGGHPRMMRRPLRATLRLVATGRIAQYRAATEAADRAERLAQARAAVKRLATAAQDPAARSYLACVRADLFVATGRPERALAVLGADVAVHRPPAPLIEFERARVRARALVALEADRLAIREVRTALEIAEEEGWPHRHGWVAAEFGSLLSGRRHASSAHASSSPGSVGDDRRRLRALEHLSAAASRVLDPDRLARVALDEIIRLLHADRAHLFLTAPSDDRLVPHLGRDAAGNDIGELSGYSTSLVEKVRLGREPLVVTGTDEGAALGAQSVVLHGLRSIMIAPLLLDDRLLGVVYLDSKVAKGLFSAADAGTLNALAGHIAVALETARTAQLEISVQVAQRQRDLADRLRAAFEAMSDTLDPATVLARLIHWAGAVVSNQGVWLVAVRGQDTVVGHLAADGTLVERPTPDDPALGPLLATAGPTTDPPLPGDLAERAPEAAAWAALPLRSRNADLGVLIVASAAAERLDDELEVAGAVVAQGMTAYVNASLFARVRELATKDELTGVANRRHLFELAEREVAAATRYDRPIVAMMLDVDHFKRVNDTYGHPSGDDVIREVAQRMRAELRQVDLLGRYGGEEFAVVVPGADRAAGRVLAERIREKVAAVPVPTRTGPVTVTISVGLAERAGATEDLASVLARADEALYAAKQAGRNRVWDDGSREGAATLPA
ncbi:hypothetical protein Val02_00010 [Virgisporangium aliadipatigenens]|uniref:Non-specific serine/threonine protein kinase n=1 Tax=Virgisporangium aliadipatigenens TaxID=741659 RepID=A0A8J3YFH6_9ACTN|nr:diguanylate cyclase [Virgisporangium aliadipatigenens]GIJ43115.1 hypothetical protein Val02_00010 [Virgisporangium aliadipatigenens]